MTLPVRFIFIHIGGGQPFLLRFKIIPVTDVLRMQCSVHYFTGPITQSIINSIYSNDSNEVYFNALPLQNVHSFDLSIEECEYLDMHCQSILRKYDPMTIEIITFETKWIKLYLHYKHIYGISNFINDFVRNYQTFKTGYFAQVQQKVQPAQITQPTIVIEETVKATEDIPQEVEVIYDHLDLDCMSLVDDCVKLCPNNVLTYYISRYIQNYIDTQYHEHEFQIHLENSIVNVTMNPLIDIQLIGLSFKHYNELISMIDSFELTKDELHSRLRSLVSQILFLINIYVENNQKKETIILPLKIAELLLFIYGCKHQNLQFEAQVPKDTPNPAYFHNYMLWVCNNYIRSFFESIDKSRFSFYQVNLTHPLHSTFVDKIENLDTFEKILAKQRYLIDLDRVSYINAVYTEMINLQNQTNTKKKTRLILSNPQVLDLELYIGKDTPKSSNLHYELIKSNHKQFETNKIITPDYHHLLLLTTNQNVVLPLIQKELNPILARNLETISKFIFPALDELDKKSLVSTLHLLTHYIRPFLPDTATLETEFFILYRCIIPYMYDIYEISKVLDYFH